MVAIAILSEKNHAPMFISPPNTRATIMPCWPYMLPTARNRPISPPISNAVLTLFINRVIENPSPFNHPHQSPITFGPTQVVRPRTNTVRIGIGLSCVRVHRLQRLCRGPEPFSDPRTQLPLHPPCQRGMVNPSRGSGLSRADPHRFWYPDHG